MASPPSPGDDLVPDRSALIAVIGSVLYVALVLGAVFVASTAIVLTFVLALAVSGDPAAFEELLTGDTFVVVAAFEAVLLGIVTVLAVAVTFSQNWVPKRAVGFAVPSPRELVIGAGTIVALLAIAAGLAFASEQLGVPGAEHALFLDDVSPIYYVALAVLSILVVGPVEELLFRGLIQNYVRPGLGSVGAVVWTSLLFAAIHLPAYLTAELASATVSLIVVFALSLVLGALYERYRNVVLVMAVHGGYNAVVFSLEIVV
ncbi:CPBP family intramembrane glutamic endopeptidase [Natrarchaeobius oligotrophus]|uniref:CPBP family intramembrane metalloprotease n=1 Tax=Natrarchaeobius chitinivorans TaxID=1679083 RepID=A0A3N6PAE8_NATCH|nr:type II CAAX endopeptidase family protein [Natrarchaeobius chitinivorans]RQG96089.1 CPBP family intramembrane metalloprotease [Natrarchaeobius chitinivorans]